MSTPARLVAAVQWWVVVVAAHVFTPVADPASRSLGTNPPLEPSATHLGATILSLRSSAGQTQGLRLVAVTLAAVRRRRQDDDTAGGGVGFLAFPCMCRLVLF